LSLDQAAKNLLWQSPLRVDSGRCNTFFFGQKRPFKLNSVCLNTAMPRNHPGEVEHYAFFNQHLGPRFKSAGLRVQFHYNQVPGIHFKVEPPAEYADAILRGLRHGLDRYFPSFPLTGSVWINKVVIDEVSSSPDAFYRAAMLVIHQALALVELNETDVLSSRLPTP
jgi:hypothetical protein